MKFKQIKWKQSENNIHEAMIDKESIAIIFYWNERELWIVRWRLDIDSDDTFGKDCLNMAKEYVEETYDNYCEKLNKIISIIQDKKS